MAFDRWSAQIIAAGDAEAQRALLGEIGVFRAQHLTDIPALREAAFAVSRLQGLLGNHEESVREARSLLSLCQTSPVATREEIRDAKAYVASLGARPGPVKVEGRGREPRKGRERSDRNERAPRTERTNTSNREDPIDRALQLAVSGDFAGALKLLRGKRGRGDVARVWIKLTKALASEGQDQLDQLQRLERSLRSALNVPDQDTKPARPTRKLEGALEVLLQEPLPKRRDAMVKLGEQFLAQNPGRADELAATMLEDHLARSGPEAPAPWLASFVVRGWEQPRTKAAIEQLRAAGSVATAIYDEGPFARAVSLVQSAPQRFSELRRGLLGRRDADETRRLWTLRVDDRERMLVLAPDVDSPWTDERARAVAERLPHLCERVVLLAPGPNNASLRQAVAGAGYLTLDGQPSDTEIFGALDNVGAIAPPKKKRDEKKRDEKASEPTKQARADARPAADAPKTPEEPEGPDAVEQFRELLGAAEIATAEALEPVLGGVRKLRDVFLATTDAWSSLPEDASARLAPVLHAADKVAPDGLKVPEAVTLALRVAAATGGPTLDALQGPVAERFAGPGIGEVVQIVKAAHDAGWTLRRAFLGTTRRERRNNAALRELEGALDGLWRLEVMRDDRRVELWYLAELPVEGRAAMPQLLLEERDRIVLLPIDPELSGWYATLDAPTALGWTGDDPEALAEALAERA